jgi:hypothetical protein
MKKFGIGLSITAAVLAVAMVLSMIPSTAASGNGAPSGAHFNLNVIGVSNVKTADITSGGRIFVPLEGRSYIWLECGDTFKVLDGNGMDKNGARLQLPDPYLGTYDPATGAANAQYRIYVRALGKPDGSAKMTSGFVDEYGNYWYSLECVDVCRKKGQSVFADKTLELTTVYVDITDDGIDNPLRYDIFGEEMYNYFWCYDNCGLKVLQMRFYMC